MTDLAVLGIAVDSTQVTTASTALERLTAMGGGAELQTQKLTRAQEIYNDAVVKGNGLTREQIKELGGYAAAINALDQAQKELATSQERAALAASSYVDRVEKLIASVDPYSAAQLRSNKVIKEADELYKAGALSAANFGLVIGANANNFDKTAASIAGTTQNLTKLKEIQDGINFQKDVNALLGLDKTFSSAKDSAAVFTNAIKDGKLAVEALDGSTKPLVKGLKDTELASNGAVRSIIGIGRAAVEGRMTYVIGDTITLTQRLGIMGVIIEALPFLAFTAGMGLMAAAVISYNREQQKMIDLSNGVGRAVGLTADQIEDASKRGGAAAGVSISAARDQAVQYASTGRIAGDNLQMMVALTEKYSNATGEKAKDATKEFGKAIADPVAGMEELNKKFSFLLPQQEQHIKSLEESGDLYGAQKELLQALSKRFEDVSNQTGFWASNLKLVADFVDHIKEGTAHNFFPTTKDIANNRLGILAGVPNEGDLVAQAQRDQAAEDARNAAAAQRDRNKNLISQGYNNANSALPGYDFIAAKKHLEDLAEQERLAIKAAVAEHANAETINFLTLAQKAYSDSAARTVDPLAKLAAQEKARIDAANAVTPAQKAAAAAEKVRADALNTVALQSKVEMEATAASTAALDKKNNSLAKHQEMLQRKIDSEAVDARLTWDAVSAYGQSVALGDQALVQAKAQALATREGMTLKQAQLQIANEENLATAREVANIAKRTAVLTDQNGIQAKLNALVNAGLLSANEATKIARDQIELAQLWDDYSKADINHKQQILDLINRTIVAQKSKNDLDAVAKAQLDLDKMQDQITLWQTELMLAEKDNIQRTIRIARIKEEQELIAKGVSRSDPTFGKSVKAAGDIALAGLQKSATDFDGSKYRAEYASFLGDIASMTKNAASDMKNEFGNIGNAFGDMVSAMADHAKDQADIQNKLTADILAAQKDAARTELAKQQAAAKTVQSQLQFDAQIAGSAASLFGKKTAAYQVLTGIETAFHALEMANAIASMAAHLTGVGVKVASVPVIVGANTAITASNTATGASAMFAALGPFGFPAVAAMLATLAALGAVGLAGSGLGGGNYKGPSAATLQAQQGTGTVLGDPTAKSSSITNAISETQKYQNMDLNYSSQMVSSLRVIQNNIGNLTTVIAQALNVPNGVFNTASLGLGTTSKGMSFLGVPLPFVGVKTSNNLIDQGLNFNPQTVGSINANGIQGNVYNTVQTDKTTSFLGITIGKSTSINQITGALSQQLVSQLSTLVNNLRDGVLTAASKLGLQGAQATLDALNLNIGKISFKGMDSKQIQDTLTSVFSDAADQMAASVIPTLQNVQKAGEGAFQTLIRVATEYTTIDDTLASIGMAFNSVGIESLTARENLIDLAGSLDDFVSQAQFFQQNFLTKEQQIAPIMDQVTRTMTALGYSGVKTTDQFAKLVLGIDVSTAEGAKLYTQLMQVAPAFKKVADYTKSTLDSLVQTGQDNYKKAQDAYSAAAQNVTNAQKNLKDAYNAQANVLLTNYNNQTSAINDLIKSFQNFSKSIKDFRATLNYGPLAALSPEEQYKQTKAMFQKTAAQAQAGDQTALANLPGVGNDFLNASKAYYASSEDYFKDLEDVKKLADLSATAADDQVTLLQRQLTQADQQFHQQMNALNDQVKGLIDINESVLSVADAIQALGSSLYAQFSAMQALQGAQNTLNNLNAANDNGGGLSPFQQLVANDPIAAINQEYQKVLGRGADLDGLGYWSSVVNNMKQAGVDPATIANQLQLSFIGSDEASKNHVPGYNIPLFARGGSLEILGNTGTDRNVMSINGEPVAMVNRGERVNISPNNDSGGVDEETKQLLREIRAELQAGNFQRGQVAMKHVDKLDDVVDGLNDVKKAVAFK